MRAKNLVPFLVISPLLAFLALPAMAQDAANPQLPPPQAAAKPQPAAKPQGPAKAALAKPAAARPAWTDRGYLAAGGMYQGGSSSFSDSYSFDSYAETGRVTSDYLVKAAPAVDLAAGVRIWRSLAIGVGFTSSSSDAGASIVAAIPHPLYLARDRQVEGSLSGTRQETAVHLQLAWGIPVGRKSLVIVGAGPSLVGVKQTLLEGIHWTSSYPYDAVTMSAADSETSSKSVVGFNAGVDVGYYFTRQVGLGVTLRYAGASTSLAARGGPVSVKAGGLQAGVGLRVRVPKASPKPAPTPAPKRSGTGSKPR